MISEKKNSKTEIFKKILFYVFTNLDREVQAQKSKEHLPDHTPSQLMNLMLGR